MHDESQAICFYDVFYQATIPLFVVLCNTVQRFTFKSGFIPSFFLNNKYIVFQLCKTIMESALDS